MEVVRPRSRYHDPDEFVGRVVMRPTSVSVLSKMRVLPAMSLARNAPAGKQSLVAVVLGGDPLGELGAGAAGGDRTHDPWLRRPILYPLSYSRNAVR